VARPGAVSSNAKGVEKIMEQDTRASPGADKGQEKVESVPFHVLPLLRLEKRPRSENK